MATVTGTSSSLSHSATVVYHVSAVAAADFIISASPTTVTVVGVNVQAELSETRDTSPAKPFTGEIVIVEVPGEFTATDTVAGLAAIVKSGRPVTV